MDEAGLSIQRLADKTKQVDPHGYGVSKSLVGSLVSQGTSARDNCRPRNAALVSAALEKPLPALFDES
jgi:hypothetical protein